MGGRRESGMEGHRETETEGRKETGTEDRRETETEGRRETGITGIIKMAVRDRGTVLSRKSTSSTRTARLAWRRQGEKRAGSATTAKETSVMRRS